MNEMSHLLVLAAKEAGGVGSEGAYVLDRMYAWYEAPHRGGVTATRAPHASFIQSFERDTRPRRVPTKEAPALDVPEEAA